MKPAVHALLGLAFLCAACASMPARHTGHCAHSLNVAPTSTALIPVPRPGDEWWVKRQESVNAQARRGDTQLIFIGDSITHSWDGVKDLWQQYYGPWHPINMGFGGDRTQHVLWRLDHGNIDGISPKAAVVMIGTNNANGQDNTAEEIAAGVTAIVDKLRAKLPRTKVLLLAIFPRGEKPDAQRAKIDRVNKMISRLDDGKMIHFLDIGPSFLDPDQTLSREIMPDFLHPNRVGYRIWFLSMKDKLNALLK